MNIEENRLRTFQSWPQNTVVLPRQLAREGFFATGNYLEAECFSCHKRTMDWQYGDCIRGRHMQLDPACFFLNNPSNSGNVPMQPRDSNSTTTQQHNGVAASYWQNVDLPQLDLKIEANRLATFQNWPNPNITPLSLAKAGFYYLNRSDQVRCAWCKGVIAKWEKEDNAFEEHQRFFPDCPRVQLGPLIEIASDGIRELGIQQISPPKRPKYSSLDARLRTYTNWPISDIQRPEALAQAGLYYHDIDDQVRCFQCFIGLRSWQKEDDPWFEHAKWYPQCQFVRLVKGVNYVQRVQEMTRHSVSQEAVESCEELGAEPTYSIEDAMCSAPVLQALEIGIDVGPIRAVTQRRLELTGQPYDTVENLLKAVFGDPDDENDDDDFTNNPTAESEHGAIATFIRHVANFVGTDDSVSSSQRADSNNVAHIREPSEASACISSASQRDDIPPTTSPETNTITESTKAVVHTPKKQLAEPLSKHQLESKNQSTSDRNLSLEEENRKLKDARLCKVCLDEEVGVVFLPCGHLVTCVQCAPGVNQCPMCRTAIKGFVRTFLS